MAVAESSADPITGNTLPVPLSGHSGGAILPKRVLVAGVAGLAVWYFAYRSLLPLAKWLTYRRFGLEEGTRLGSSIEFFMYDTPKVLLLLTLVVFAVGVVRSYFTADGTRGLVVGAAGGAHRHPDVQQRRGDHPDRGRGSSPLLPASPGSAS